MNRECADVPRYHNMATVVRPDHLKDIIIPVKNTTVKIPPC